MKQFAVFLMLCTSLQFAGAQITTPVVRANFGIEADLMANYFNSTPLGSVDDWWYAPGINGTGDFVIDTSGAAAVVAGYTNNPASLGWTISRIMRQEPYTVVSNHLLLDAVFQRDFHGNDSTVFASGSNKNGMSPALWSCPVSQGIPDKNDILDAYAHVRRAGPDPTDSLWMFGGLSIENTTGSRYFDFELYQTNIAYDRPNQSFTGFGPDAGHTSWAFDGAGNIVSPGDIIFTAEFSSSSLSLVEARIWINKADLAVNPSTFNWGGDFDGDGSGANFGYANIVPKTTGDFYTGILNTTTAAWAGPFALVRVDNSVVTTYLKRQFMEFSVNLSKLGIDPAFFSNNACGTPFRRVLVKSRASTSFTAELKDFIAPFSMFSYLPVDANAFIQYFCGSMPEATATIQVYNPVSTFVYTWSTNDGAITGTTNGTSITVSAPGTYYVTQQLHAACPAFAIDSVKILYDSVCQVLKVGITQFTASINGSKALLQWTVNGNETAQKFIVEYSEDNSLFKELAGINGTGKTGMATYELNCGLNEKSPLVFVRIKAIGKSNAAIYSRVVALHTGADMEAHIPHLFPNPTNGKIWISLQSGENGTIGICITDAAGRILQNGEVPVKQGFNQLPFQNISGQPPGIYLVKIKTREGETVQKLLLQK